MERGWMQPAAVSDAEAFGLCDRVRQAGFELHRFLRGGHLERVYENGLAHRLHLAGMNAARQVPIRVRDQDGTMLGDFVADMVVEQCVIVEIKAARAIADEHLAQLLGYLAATGFRHGLLINFGTFKYEIRKLVR